MAQNTEFKLVLGLGVMIFAFGVGSLIGGGPFGLTGFAVGYSGPSFLFVIMLLALLNFPTVMVYAELALAIPDAGGGYAWIKMAFSHYWGHLAGWTSWGAHMVACAVYALNIGYYAIAILAQYIFPDTAFWGGNQFWIIGIAIAFIIFWSIINILGTSQSGRFGMYLVLCLIGVLTFYVVLGVITILLNPAASKDNFAELMPKGAWGFITATGMFCLAFQGSEIVAQAVKELKDAKKDLKRALFYSYGIIVVIYIAVAFVALSGVHGDERSWVILAEAREGAVAESASYFVWGSILVLLMLGAGFVASLAALNSTIFSASHTAKALGDAKSLPYPFSILLTKRKSPVFAILVSAGLMVFMVIALPVEGVAAVANLLFILLFISLNAALIKLRVDRPEIVRPYKVPLFPLLNLAAIAGYIVIAIPLLSVSAWGVTIFVIWFLIGALVWFLFAKKNVEEEIDSALVREGYFPFGRQTYAKVVCPITATTNWKALLPIVHAVAKKRDTAFYFCLLLALPKGVTSFKEFAENDPLKSEMMERAAEFHDNLVSEYQGFTNKVSLRFSAVAVSDVPPSFERIERFDEVQIIRRIVEKLDADVLILPFEQFEFFKRGFGWAMLTRLLRQTRCNLMVAKVGLQGANNLQNCLVPYASSPHKGLLFETIRAIKEYNGLSFHMRFFHIVKGVGNNKREIAQVKDELKKGGFSNGDLIDVIEYSGDKSEKIAESAKEYDLVLMAASKDRWFQEMEFGHIAEDALRNLPTTTIVVHRHQEFWHVFLTPLARLYEKFYPRLK